MSNKNYIYSPKADIIFILSPPFVLAILFLLFPSFTVNSDLNPAIWLIAIVGIDVAHVYSTLYRTYFDTEVFRKNRRTYILIPVVCCAIAMLIYAFSEFYFWRILAYTAVFHFIRQQYGFMRIYNRSETNKVSKLLDTIFIYSATTLPILIWHFEGPKEFHWFMDNDFIYYKLIPVAYYLKCLLMSISTIYFIYNIIRSFTNKFWNLPKYLLALGTLISWYGGIVYFNNDLIFTLFNVICHGIPYIALIWFYGHKKYISQNQPHPLKFVFQPKFLLVFLAILLIPAFIEEGFWDAWIWQDHTALFPGFNQLTPIINPDLKAIIVPILILPQLTHYVLDGFIWKIQRDKHEWKKITLE